MRKRHVLGVALGSCLAVLASVGLAAVDTSEFVGSGRCQQCHPTAHKAWQGSPHARAHLALSGKQTSDPRCTQCHGTTERELGGVQCESCHGGGRYYAQRHVMKDAVLSRIVGLRDVNEESCRGCHSDAAPTVRAFDHARLWRAIEHGREPKPAPAQAPAKGAP